MNKLTPEEWAEITKSADEEIERMCSALLAEVGHKITDEVISAYLASSEAMSAALYKDDYNMVAIEYNKRRDVFRSLGSELFDPYGHGGFFERAILSVAAERDATNQ